MPRRLRAALSMTAVWTAASAALTTVLTIGVTVLAGDTTPRHLFLAAQSGVVFGALGGALAGAGFSVLVALGASSRDITHIHRRRETLVFFGLGALAGTMVTGAILYSMGAPHLLVRPLVYLPYMLLFGGTAAAVGTGVLAAARRAGTLRSAADSLRLTGGS